MRLTPESMLYRQVHPSWIDDGRPTSQAFKPTKKDKKKMSVDDSGIVSAEKAFEIHTKVFSRKSVGVLAVTVEECTQNNMSVTSDPLVNRPSHAVVDFEGLSRREIEKTATTLKVLAMNHQWKYVAPEFTDKLIM